MVAVFGDAPAALANHIRALLDARTEAYIGSATVGTRTPAGRDPYAVGQALVVVTQDAPGIIQNRANARAPIRITVWHATDDEAYDLAALAQGLALAYVGPVVRSVLPGLSPVRAADPDTGEPMAWCTVTANIAPHNI